MLTRPPPLQLQHDNTRPGYRPAPQPEPKIENKGPGFIAQLAIFAAQVYRANWRNLVIGVAAINTLRFLISALTAFHDIDVADIKSRHVPKLTQISLALGALYLLTAVLQCYGAISAAMQRITLIRVYVHLAFLSAVLITAAGFITSIEYFLLSEDIIDECVALSIKGSRISKSIFRGKLNHNQIPNAKVAREECLNAWSRGSVSQVVTVLVFFLIPAFAFFALAYTYYRQTTDPTHPANLLSRTVGEVRLESFANVRYSPISQSENGNGAGRAGSPRGRVNRNDDNSRRVLNHNNTMQKKGQGQGQGQGQKQKLATTMMMGRSTLLQQLSPMMRTASSQSPYGISPGPPSFAAPRTGAYEYGHGPVWLSDASDDR